MRIRINDFLRSAPRIWSETMPRRYGEILGG
jgi:hypothetical protein